MLLVLLLGSKRLETSGIAVLDRWFPWSERCEPGLNLFHVGEFGDRNLNFKAVTTVYPRNGGIFELASPTDRPT